MQANEYYSSARSARMSLQSFQFKTRVPVVAVIADRTAYNTW